MPREAYQYAGLSYPAGSSSRTCGGRPRGQGAVAVSVMTKQLVKEWCLAFPREGLMLLEAKDVTTTPGWG